MLKGPTGHPPVFLRGNPSYKKQQRKKLHMTKQGSTGLWIGHLIMLFVFFPFGTSHTFSDVTPWLCMLYAHIWYFWIQHNSIFQSSYDMSIYDNLWPSNYKVTENNLKIYSFLASPPILGMCFKVSIHYIHQDIHFNLLPRGKVTS